MAAGSGCNGISLFETNMKEIINSDRKGQIKIEKLKMNKTHILTLILILVTGLVTAQETKPPVSAEELAKKLSNPVASLISVPFQNNMDVGIGPYNGSKNTLNFQPVIPINMTAKYNLITRFIIPLVSQHDITGEGTSQSGLSDAVISAWVSPAEAKNGLTWGVGPVFLVPIATNDFLGTKKFGVGPTALVLKQTHGWTMGALVNQIWSVAGASDRADVNQMFVQPFVSYNWKSGAGLGVNAEITQNWEGSTTSVFINPTISGVTKIGKQTIQLLIGPRLQLAAPNGNKAAFGVRTMLVFVFPK
jgi:hypothetical protein